MPVLLWYRYEQQKEVRRRRQQQEREQRQERKKAEDEAKAKVSSSPRLCFLCLATINTNLPCRMLFKVCYQLLLCPSWAVA